MIGPMPPYPLPIGGYHAQVISRKRTLSWANGWQGEIKVKIPGAESASFINDNALTPFPGTSNLRPQQVVEELLEGSPIDVDGTPDWVIQTWTYGIDFLSDAEWPTAVPRPTFFGGTTLKLKVKSSGQFMVIPCYAPTPSSVMVNGVPVPYTGPPPRLNPTPSGRILIPIIDYEVEWDRVPLDGNHLGFRDYIGSVNETTFMGCEPETLLCEAVDGEPSWLLNASSPFSFKAVARLKKRRIAGTLPGGQAFIFGWNHEYDIKQQRWVYINIVTDPGPPQVQSPRYPVYDFSALFQ